MSLAVRNNSTTGVEERLEHITSPHGLLYSWTARPPGAAAAAVICSPILGDFISNYHRERLLGQAIAAAGLGAIRFHYAGEGNSEGKRADLTFESMCADTLAVMAHARSLDFSRLALVGTRLGALVAAAGAASIPGSPLALWEPTSNPLAFIKEARRAKRMSQVAQRQDGPRLDWREELALNGVLDLMGHDVYPPLVESLEGASLIDLIGDGHRPMFIARFGNTDPESSLTEALAKKGFDVVEGAFDLSEAWWFHSELVTSSGDLIGTTTRWLQQALQIGGGTQ